MKVLVPLLLLFFLFSCNEKNPAAQSFREKPTELAATGCNSRGCSGSDNCSACKNCSGCKHCAKQGGTCGVCAPPKKGKRK